MIVKKHFLEVIVIFFSVMLAFIAEDWRENRQGNKDFNNILVEIENNVRLDSIELGIDVKDIQIQLKCLELLLGEEQLLSNDSISICIARIMHTHWPDYITTGIDQLRNSQNLSQNSELMEAIYDYYTYSKYHEAITPFFFTEQVENLREYLIKERLSPSGAGIYASVKFDENEIQSYRKALIKPELQARLKHLHNNRKHMMEFYQKRMQIKCQKLLTLLNKETMK